MSTLLTAALTPLNLLAQADSVEYEFSGAEGAVAGGVALVIIAFALMVSLAIAAVIAFLFYKPYSKVPEQYQTLSPGLIWLLIIPLVNIVILFLIAFQVPTAFKNYFDAVGDPSVGDAGKQLGMWWAICAVCSIIPILNFIAGPAALVLMILFLVKIWGMAGKIPDGAAAPPSAMA